jgi:hypothetical protein
MSRFAVNLGLLAGCVFAGLVSAASAQAPAPPPNLGANGWLNQGTFGGGGLLPAPGTPAQFLFHQHPDHPFVPNGTGRQPTYRVADLDANPNVKQWAKDIMKKDNDEVIAGKIAKTSRQSCDPAGLPGYDMYGFQPIHFLQEPKKVTMIFSGDQQVRHVYMNVPHSKDVKPSWYGESVGHYEGDTLVIDTIGLNTKFFVDNYRTPHTDKLHTVERYKLVEGGKAIEISIEVEDPGAFTTKWTARQRWVRQQEPLMEVHCNENNEDLFNLYPVPSPKAEKPDF